MAAGDDMHTDLMHMYPVKNLTLCNKSLQFCSDVL